MIFQDRATLENSSVCVCVNFISHYENVTTFETAIRQGNSEEVKIVLNKSRWSGVQLQRYKMSRI
jgi:hypothetical protein